MKFLAMTLVAHRPDSRVSTTARLRAVVAAAIRAERLGFDGFAVGERHERPFLSSAPPVLLSHLAAVTSRIRLFTAVTTLSLLDPVRAYEDYATLDQLSGGRLELIIGKGNGVAQAKLFAVTAEDQWDRNREGYELFRQLWRQEQVTWHGRYRPALVEAEALPRPYQQPIRVWHGSATSRDSVELAARHGDPLFSANVTHPVEPYAQLVDYYRERWSDHQHDPRDAVVGAGFAALHVARRSQDAIEQYRPVFARRVAALTAAGVEPVFTSLEDAISRGSYLVGSPQQVIEQVHRYHERLGHEVMHVPAEADGLPEPAHRASLDLFVDEVAPVLRDAIPSRPLLDYGRLT
jgi:alkanesulfonate monooxygenase SsuD/methylene tetrahydromethanopterin reductase-like flavin-dependent oxidoreductase (luciferase family)